MSDASAATVDYAASPAGLAAAHDPLALHILFHDWTAVAVDLLLFIEERQAG